MVHMCTKGPQRVNRVTKTAKQNYYNEAIEANKNNQDQMWKVVKCLVQLKSKTKTLPTDLKAGDMGLLNDQEVICNQFNHFFANIGKNLSELIPLVTEHLTNNRDVTTKHLFFTPTTPEEVATFICSSKAKKSVRENDVSIKFLKCSNLILLPYISNLLNCFVEQGKF